MKETKIYDKKNSITTTSIKVTKGGEIKLQMDGDNIPIPVTAIGSTLRARMSVCMTPEEAERMISQLQTCVAYLRKRSA